MVKGNSGKAARNRLIRRLMTVIVCCLIVITIYEFTGNGRSHRRHNNMKQLNVISNVIRENKKQRKVMKDM